MQWNILQKKALIDKNGEQIIDITSQSMQYIDDDPTIVDQFYVGDDLMMRPDLLSYLAYNSDDYFDYILKFNGISNPFAIDVGDFILAPDLQFMELSLKDPIQENLGQDIRDQYINPSKKGTVDPNRLEFDQALQNLRKNSEKINFAKYPLPPNLSAPGDKEGTVSKDNTSVILGNDVTKSK